MYFNKFLLSDHLQLTHTHTLIGRRDFAFNSPSLPLCVCVRERERERERESSVFCWFFVFVFIFFFFFAFLVFFPCSNKKRNKSYIAVNLTSYFNI